MEMPSAALFRSIPHDDIVPRLADRHSTRKDNLSDQRSSIGFLFKVVLDVVNFLLLQLKLTATAKKWLRASYRLFKDFFLHMDSETIYIQFNSSEEKNYSHTASLEIVFSNITSQP